MIENKQAMGALTNERIALLQRWAYKEIPLWKNLMVRYGFGGIALILAGYFYINQIEGGVALIAALVLGVAHAAYREWFMRTIRVADMVRKHVIERKPYMIELERDPEMHAIGAFIRPSDWPRIAETGFRIVVINAYETTLSKAFSFVGYGLLVIVGLIGN